MYPANIRPSAPPPRTRNGPGNGCDGSKSAWDGPPRPDPETRAGPSKRLWGAAPAPRLRVVVTTRSCRCAWVGQIRPQSS